LLDSYPFGFTLTVVPACVQDVLKKESALAAFKSKKKKSDNIVAIPRPPEGDDAMDLDNNLPPPPANTTFR